MRIPPEIYKHIEFELHMYQANKDTLKMELERILEESPPSHDGQPGSNKIGNPTESKAISRICSASIVTLEKHINAIESVLKPLSETHKKLFEEYYIRKRKNKIILSNELNISLETFKRYRRAIIYGVGYTLGWICSEIAYDLKLT